MFKALKALFGAGKKENDETYYIVSGGNYETGWRKMSAPLYGSAPKKTTPA